MRTIVVADDFPNTRKVVEFTLNKLGDVAFLHANDGKEALNYFDGRKIDILITDYNMPNMDGGELTKHVRSIKDYEFIPILILTTEKDEGKKQSAKEMGITAWVKKPFATEEFLEIVKRCLPS